VDLVIERSLEEITKQDLRELYDGSRDRLEQYFISGEGNKWLSLYDIANPIVVALCQGAALHYFDKINGVKDFDVWFFYPFNTKHLPYRTYWNWDYKNQKFGRHPKINGYSGRKVDVLARSIRNYTRDNPVETVYQYLESENTRSSMELAKKAVVLLYPPDELGNTVWYKGRCKS